MKNKQISNEMFSSGNHNSQFLELSLLYYKKLDDGWWNSKVYIYNKILKFYFRLIGLRKKIGINNWLRIQFFRDILLFTQTKSNKYN